MFNIKISGVVAVACLAVAGCSPADAPDPSAAAPAAKAQASSNLELAEGHFHPKGKAPSEYTQKVFEEARKTLPFSDRDDFDEWERGFIARREDLKIMADTGDVAWDMERYLFLDEPEKIASVHPSMLRMSELNNNYGLYEVIPGIYQVRGFDLANVTLSTRTRMAIILVAFAAWLAWKMWLQGKSRLLPPETSWISQLPRMFTPETP